VRGSVRAHNVDFREVLRGWEMVACTYKDVKRANRGQPPSGKTGVLQLSGDRVS
jgi:hypothetical protein